MQGNNLLHLMIFAWGLLRDHRPSTPAFNLSMYAVDALWGIAGAQTYKTLIPILDSNQSPQHVSLEPNKQSALPSRRGYNCVIFIFRLLLKITELDPHQAVLPNFYGA